MSLAVMAGCAQAPKNPPGPPPPQNLLGTTDELQLVTELSVNLAAQYGGENVLVVMEIDNMLLTTDRGDYAGSCGEFETGGKEPSASNMRPAQADTAKQIQRIQEAGMRAIVVTSRAPACLAQTFEDLGSNDLNFAASAWHPQAGYPEPFLLEGVDQPVVYRDGVFFANGQDKGAVLKAFLDKAGDPKPVIIVMADSDREDLNAVMKTFSWTKTKVHAWRYTRESNVAIASGP